LACLSPTGDSAHLNPFTAFRVCSEQNAIDKRDKLEYVSVVMDEWVGSAYAYCMLHGPHSGWRPGGGCYCSITGVETLVHGDNKSSVSFSELTGFVRTVPCLFDISLL
jgi:hypothetical protein